MVNVKGGLHLVGMTRTHTHNTHTHNTHTQHTQHTHTHTTHTHTTHTHTTHTQHTLVQRRTHLIPACAYTVQTATPVQIVTRQEGNVLQAAMASMQRETVLDDFTRPISLGLTLTYLTAAVAAQECMQRAVVLTGRVAVDVD